jgi:Rrf2 family protein
MITKTTENAVQVLLYLSKQKPERVISHHEMAQKMDVSPSYLSKVLVNLVKAGLIKSFRGASGGVQLNYAPEQINLLQIIEACQGILPQPYCSTPLTADVHICGFHRAMQDVREQTLNAMRRWTLQDLHQCPFGTFREGVVSACHMNFMSRLPDEKLVSPTEISYQI